MGSSLAALALALIAGLLAVHLARDKWLSFKVEWHLTLGRYDRALPLLRGQLDRLRRKYGENHPDTVVAKYSLGMIQYEHGHRDEGIRLVSEATDFFAGYQGPQDKLYCAQLVNLGLAQRSIERRDLAAASFRRAADLERQLHGAESSQYAGALSNLGATLEETGNAREAIAIHEEVLRIRDKLHGDKSRDSAKAHVNLAEAYTSLEQWPAAERHIRQAVEVLRSVPMPELGQAYDTYARLLEQQDRLGEAEEMRIKALSTFERALGSANAEVARQMEKYASLLERLDRQTECRLMRRKVSAIREVLA